MSFDPGMIMALMSAITGGLGAMNGNEGEQKSSYSEGQQGGINDILNMVKGMKGKGIGDITQNQGFQSGQNWINDLFNDQNFFDKFESPMQRQFSEQTMPDLASRFASQGSGGSLGSTAFRNQANREGERLQESIASMRGGMQSQGVNQALNYAQTPFQNMMQMYGLGTGSPMMNQYQPPNAGIGAMAAPFMQGAASYWGGQGGQNNNNQSYANGGGNAPMAPPQMIRSY